MGSNGRLIGGLAGLGGGGAICAAVGYWLFNDPEGPMFILGPLFGAAIATMGFVAGYFIGRTADKLAPEFVIERSHRPLPLTAREEPAVPALSR